MVSHKRACWNSYSVFNTLLHSSLLYLNILEFKAIFMLMTPKYIYLFHRNLLLFFHQLNYVLDMYTPRWLLKNYLLIQIKQSIFFLIQNISIIQIVALILILILSRHITLQEILELYSCLICLETSTSLL